MEQEIYESFLEYYFDELGNLDDLMEAIILTDKNRTSERNNNKFKGLVVTEDEILQLFGNEDESLGEDISQRMVLMANFEARREEIIKKRKLSSDRGVQIPLQDISKRFSLNSFEEKCLLLCLALELDNKYEKIFAFLQDNVTSKRPTMALVLKLFSQGRDERLLLRQYLDKGSKLKKYFLASEAEPQNSTFLSGELRLDERMLQFLLGTNTQDSSIAAFISDFRPEDVLPELITGIGEQNRLRSYVEKHINSEMNSKSSIVYLWGPKGCGKRMHIKALCKHLGANLLLVDFEKMGASNLGMDVCLQLLQREARLRQAYICFCRCFQNLEDKDSGQEHSSHGGQVNSNKRFEPFIEFLQANKGIVFILSNEHYRLGSDLRGQTVFEMEIPMLTDVERMLYWETFQKEYVFSKSMDWALMASKFRFTQGNIKAALETAQDISSWHESEIPGISEEDLRKACQAQCYHHLDSKALRIKPVYTWDELILPEEQVDQLKNACNQMKYRHIVYGAWGFDKRLTYGKGLSVLFSGPPGTGKTMAAQVIAKDLELELYKIDLATVISKYIGETEKNLSRIFAEAQASNAILFFDEADAMFGKRSEVKDANDRYANVETAYLIQRIEEYEGITILATNLIKNIDEAFMRRISFVVEFPFPDAIQRERIWKGMFPKDTPLSEDVDFQYLSGKFEVAGGNIKNIAISSAFLAAAEAETISMRHILKSVRGELQKTGKVLLKDDMEGY